MNSLAVCRKVVIHNSERWGVNHVVHAEIFANCLDKSCLSCAHFPVERKNSFLWVVGNKLFRAFLNFIQRVYFYFHDKQSDVAFLSLHGDERNQHFFHRNTAMLERIFVIRGIIIVVVRIGEE